MAKVPILPARCNYWVEMKDVRLIEAILLSVGVDPRKIPRRFCILGTPRIRVPGYPELCQRTDIALNHFRKHGLEQYDLEQRVELKAFRAWAEGLKTPWKLPNQFPRDVPRHKSEPTQGPVKESPKRLDAFRHYLFDLIKRHPKSSPHQLWAVAVDDAKRPESERPYPLISFAEGEIKWRNDSEDKMFCVSMKSFFARVRRLNKL